MAQVQRRRKAQSGPVDQALRKLWLRASPDIHSRVVTDATQPLRELETAVEASNNEPAQLLKVVKGLRKWSTRKPKQTNVEVQFSSATVCAATNLMLKLLRLAPKISSNGSGASHPLERSNSLHKVALDSVLSLCARAEAESDWIVAFDFVREFSDFTHVRFRDFLSEDKLGLWYGKINSNLLKSYKRALRDGRVAEADALYRRFLFHEGMKTDARTEMMTLLEEQAATLPSETQRWLVTALSLDENDQRIVYSSEAESPDVQQAAGLLLFLWEQSQRQAESREAYERFRAICENHFRLRLAGAAGEVMPFDPRLHESSSAKGERVKVIRPRVEWINPPEARVVIRSIVEPA